MPHPTPPTIQDLDEPKLEALIEVMFLAAFADGEFGAEEKSQFTKSVESLTDQRVSASALDGLVGRMAKDLERAGRDARLSAIKERLKEAGARKVAFGLAIQIVAADGIVRTSERELLFDLAEGLEIDRNEAADMVRDMTKS